MRPETLPAVAPLEPTTPIKPSEAIRLGCLIAPVQGHGEMFEAPNTACALGAMLLGFGYNGPRLPRVQMPRGDPYSLAHEHLPGLYGKVFGLNDQNRWSRERIADWLAEQGL